MIRSHRTCLLYLVVLTVASRSFAQDANVSRTEQLRLLGADNIRVVDGHLSYLDLKDSQFSDDAASLIEDQQSLVFLSVARTSITDRTLSIICRLKQLKWLFLDSTRITDGSAEKFRDLANLRTLSVAHTSVSDKTFARCSWKNIRTLVLADTNITDATVKSVSRLTTIRHLNLSGTFVTDDCAPSLLALRNLTRLNLSHTQVTAAGLAKLTDLPNLRELDVRGTAVTATAVETFRTKRPNCRIRGPKTNKH